MANRSLVVEAATDNGEVIKFGKNEAKVRPPKQDTGLMYLGGELDCKELSHDSIPRLAESGSVFFYVPTKGCIWLPKILQKFLLL